MIDVFAVADIIVKQIKTHYAQDIAIVGYYGSYQRGGRRNDLIWISSSSRPRRGESK